MTNAYAYLGWRCSECGGEPIEREGLLVCETDGLTFEPDSATHATLVPDEEDED